MSVSWARPASPLLGLPGWCLGWHATSLVDPLGLWVSLLTGSLSSEQLFQLSFS